MKYKGYLGALLLAVGLLAACNPQQPEQATSASLVPPASIDEPVEMPAGVALPEPSLGILRSARTPQGEEILNLINVERSRADCPPLAPNDQLLATAASHSRDMALNDYFSHDGQDGSKFYERILGSGYLFSRAAENLAVGAASAEQTVRLWMQSAPHRDNILNCDLQQTGIGYFFLEDDQGNVNFNHYWTQVFASPR